jgi:GAF domain-containing protein/ActR/RegA family two-component response regulator
VPGESNEKPGLTVNAAKNFFRRTKGFLARLSEIAARIESRQKQKALDRVLNAANAVAAAALESADPDELLTKSLKEILHATGMHAGAIYLAEEGDDSLAMTLQAGLPEKLTSDLALVPSGDGLVGKAFSRNDVLALSDLKMCSDPSVQKWLDCGYRSFIGAPIASDEKFLGVICLFSKRNRVFRKACSNAFMSIARVLGRAVEKSRAYKQMEEALVGIRRIGRAKFEAPLPGDSGQTIENLACSVSEAALALSSMILLTDEDGHVVRRAVSGYTRRALAAVAGMDAAAARVVKTGQLLLLSNPDKVKEFLGPKALESGSESCVCLPMQIGERAVGVLWLNYESPRNFAAWELEQLQSLADRAASVIENSRLYSSGVEKVERYRELQRHCAKIASSTDLRGAVQSLADSARELLRVRTAFVSLTGSGLAEKAISTVPRIEASRLGTGHAGAASSPDIGAQEPRRSTEFVAPAVCAAAQAAANCGRVSLTVSLLDDQNEPVGTLTVAEKIRGGGFNDEDAEILDALAEHAMVAIRNAASRQQVEHLVEEYKALLDTSPVALAIVTKDQTIATVNAKFADLTGFSPGEIEGKMSLFDLLPETERASLRALTDPALGEAGEAPAVPQSDVAPAFPLQRESEATLITKNGNQKKVKLTVGEMRNSGSMAVCLTELEERKAEGGPIKTQESSSEGNVFVIEHRGDEETVQDTRAESACAVMESPPLEAPKKPAAKKVLVIDDERVVVDLLDYFLRSEGLNVEVSRDGRTALSKLKESDYDLIFCDLKIPGVSGQEVFRWLEKNRPELAQRVIFVTGDVATSETLSFLNHPPKRWLEKPFDLTELRQTVAAVLAQSRL